MVQNNESWLDEGNDKIHITRLGQVIHLGSNGPREKKLSRHERNSSNRETRLFLLFSSPNASSQFHFIGRVHFSWTHGGKGNIHTV